MITKTPTRAEEVAPSGPWAKLLELPRPKSPKHTLRARGKDVGEVVFEVLMAQQLLWAAGAAHRAAKEIVADQEANPGSLAYEEIYQDRRAIELVVLATKQAEDPRFPVFTNADDVSKHMTNDEIGVLLAAYGAFKRESSPVAQALPDEEAEAVRQMLLAGTGSRIMLANYGPEALSDLVVYLVSRERPAANPGSPAPEAAAE